MSKMFGINESECTGFDSKWKIERNESTAQMQTTPYKTTENGSNTNFPKEIQIQTDNTEHTELKYDENDLSKWLTDLYPKVKSEMNETGDAIFKKHTKTSDDFGTYTLQQSLDVLPDDRVKKTLLQVSCICWNSSGQTLAVSCTYRHKTWCHHTGSIQLFTVNRDGLLPLKATKELSTDSCINVLCFHTNLTYVVAGGSYTGEIYVWNLQIEANTYEKCNGHNALVTQVSWIQDVKNSKISLLVTSGLDGFINIWNSSINTPLTLKQRFKIKTPILPKDYTKPIERVIRGVICFDFSPFQPDLFVIGAEGGLVAHCSVIGARKLRGDAMAVAIQDPVCVYYKSCNAEVIGVAFSPDRKEMFLTAGSDGEIRIYILEQDEAAQIVFVNSRINCAVWIPKREKIIAVGCVDGKLILLNVSNGKIISRIGQENANFVITCMQIDRKRPSFVTVGTNLGELQIWHW